MWYPTFYVYWNKSLSLYIHRNNGKIRQENEKRGNLQRTIITEWDSGVSECYYLFKTASNAP